MKNIYEDAHLLTVALCNLKSDNNDVTDYFS
jgi:hypothetical protein